MGFLQVKTLLGVGSFGALDAEAEGRESGGEDGSAKDGLEWVRSVGTVGRVVESESELVLEVVDKSATYRVVDFLTTGFMDESCHAGGSAKENDGLVNLYCQHGGTGRKGALCEPQNAMRYFHQRNTQIPSREE